MVLPNNMLLTLSHIVVVNIPLDLIFEQCYPLYAKITSFCFTCALVIVNPIILINKIFDLVKLNLKS